MAYIGEVFLSQGLPDSLGTELLIQHRPVFLQDKILRQGVLHIGVGAILRQVMGQPLRQENAFAGILGQIDVEGSKIDVLQRAQHIDSLLQVKVALLQLLAALVQGAAASNGENIPKGGIQRHEHGGYRRCIGKGRKYREIDVELTALAGGAAAQVAAALNVEEVELVIVRELVQRLQNGERVGFLALKGIIAAGQYGVSGCDDVGAAAIDVNTIEKGGHILLDIQNQSSGLFVKSDEEAGGIQPGNSADIVVVTIILHSFGIDFIGAGHPVEQAAFGGILPGGALHGTGITGGL